MFSFLSRVFGGNNDDESNAQLESDKAREELTAIRSQIAAMQAQLERTTQAVTKLTAHEAEMVQQLHSVQLECHDGYLHPELEDAEPLPRAELIEAMAPEWRASQQQLAADAAAAVEHEGELDDSVWVDDAVERGVIPAPRPETRTASCGEVRASIIGRRVKLHDGVIGVLRQLRSKRHELDENVFKLELKLTRLDAEERKLRLEVGRLEENGVLHESDEEVRARNARRRMEAEAPPQAIVARDPASPLSSRRPEQRRDDDTRDILSSDDDDEDPAVAEDGHNGDPAVAAAVRNPQQEL